MKLRFTHHAQFRMDERGIAVSNIKTVLQNPDHIEDTFGGKLLARKKIDGKIFAVIYTQRQNEFIIVTIYQI